MFNKDDIIGDITKPVQASNQHSTPEIKGLDVCQCLARHVDIGETFHRYFKAAEVSLK